MAKIGLTLMLLLAQAVLAVAPVAACCHADGTVCPRASVAADCCVSHARALPLANCDHHARGQGEKSLQGEVSNFAEQRADSPRRCHEAHLRLVVGNGVTEKLTDSSAAKRPLEPFHFAHRTHDWFEGCDAMAAHLARRSPASWARSAPRVALATVVLRC